MKFAVVTFSVTFFTVVAHANNYADCILDKMPGSENEAVTTAVIQTCLQENSGSFYEIFKGSGRGIFGYKDSNACILKKAKDTKNQRGAFLISAACRCLYDEPFYKNEPCAVRQ
jgi:hypothetical protein